MYGNYRTGRPFVDSDRSTATTDFMTSAWRSPTVSKDSVNANAADPPPRPTTFAQGREIVPSEDSEENGTNTTQTLKDEPGEARPKRVLVKILSAETASSKAGDFDSLFRDLTTSNVQNTSTPTIEVTPSKTASKTERGTSKEERAASVSRTDTTQTNQLEVSRRTLDQEKPHPCCNLCSCYLEDDISHFYTSRLSPKNFKRYRCMVCAFTLCVYVTTSVMALTRRSINGLSGLTFLAFVTIWSAILLTADVILSAYLAVTKQQRLTKSGKLPAILKIHWCLYYLSANGSIIVTLGFWTVVYHFLPTGIQKNAPFTIHVHGLNMVYHVANVFIADTTIRMQHAWIPMAYCSLYVVFTGVYHAAGGMGVTTGVIYPVVLDYKQYTELSVCMALVLGLVAPLMSHSILYGLKNLNSHWNHKVADGTGNESAT